MNLKLKRTPGIYLVGFMGSGKSTVGRLLADQLGWQFVDLDEDIEAREQCPISEIFASRGEDEFRRVEAETIRSRVRAVECGCPMVIALGGGAFVQSANVDLLQNNGVTIWLDAPFEIIRERLASEFHRPLARDLEQCERLYYDRREGYARADYRIDAASDSAAQIVGAVLGLPLFE